MICKNWKRWEREDDTHWKCELASPMKGHPSWQTRPVALSLCGALESFQREEAFRYPGVRLSALFQCSLRPDAQWHSTDSCTEAHPLTQLLTPLAAGTHFYEAQELRSPSGCADIYCEAKSTHIQWSVRVTKELFYFKLVFSRHSHWRFNFYRSNYWIVSRSWYLTVVSVGGSIAHL